MAFFGGLAAPELLKRFLEAEGEDEARAFLESHPEMLSVEVHQALLALVDDDADDRLKRVVARTVDFLDRCREIGIAGAYAERESKDQQFQLGMALVKLKTAESTDDVRAALSATPWLLSAEADAMLAEHAADTNAYGFDRIYGVRRLIRRVNDVGVEAALPEYERFLVEVEGAREHVSDFFAAETEAEETELVTKHPTLMLRQAAKFFDTLSEAAAETDDEEFGNVVRAKQQRLLEITRELDPSLAPQPSTPAPPLNEEQLIQLLAEMDGLDDPRSLIEAHPELLSQDADDILTRWTETRPQLAAGLESLRAMFKLYRKAAQQTIEGDASILAPIVISIKSFVEAAWEDVSRVVEQNPDLLTSDVDIPFAWLIQSVDPSQQAALKARWEFLKSARTIGVDAALRELTRAEPEDELSDLLAVAATPVPSGGLSARTTLVRRALDLAAVGSDRGLEAQLSAGLADLLMLDGRDPVRSIDKAIRLYHRALRALSAGSPVARGRVLLRLGNSLLQRLSNDQARNIERAIKVFRVARRLFNKETHPKDWGHAITGLGVAYELRRVGARRENIERAIAYHRTALRVRDRNTDPVNWAESQQHLGLAYKERIDGDPADNLDRAILHLRRCTRVLSASDNPHLRSVATKMASNLSNAFAERQRGDRQRNLRKAVAYGRRALRGTSRTESPYDWAAILTNLGMTLAALVGHGQSTHRKRALRCLELALTVYRREKMPIEWAKTCHQLASVRIRLGRPEDVEEAIRAEMEALSVITPSIDRSLWAGIMHNLGLFYPMRQQGSAEENRTRAAEVLVQALTVRTLEASPLEHMQTQKTLGHVKLGNDNFAEAIAALRGARDAEDFLLRVSLAPDARELVRGTAEGIDDELAFALAKLGKFDESLMAMERGRARELAERLRIQDAPLAQLTDGDRAEFTRLRNEIQLVQGALRSTSATDPDGEALRLSQALTALHRELDDLVDTVRRYVPSFLDEPDLARTWESPANEALACFIVTATGSCALVAERNERRIIPLPLADSYTLRHHATTYFRAYAVWRAGPANDVTARAAWMNEIDELTGWLHSAIMAPVLDCLDGATDVVLVASGWLGMLPLHAAWESTNDNGGRRFALDRATLRVAPSLHAYLAAKRDADRAPSRLLAIDEPRPVQAAPLPGSAVEVGAAASRFEQATVLRHAEVTRRAVLDALSGAGVIHLSCHGIADPDRPLLSALLLSNDERLTVADLMSAPKLSARLTVLSSCETGLTGVTLPSEAIGMATAFLQAGSCAAIAAIWAVGGMSTALLFARFYELWNPSSETGPLVAFRAAQLWLRDTTNGEKAEHFRKGSRAEGGLPSSVSRTLFRNLALLPPEEMEHSHPLNWAGFVFTGA